MNDPSPAVPGAGDSDVASRLRLALADVLELQFGRAVPLSVTTGVLARTSAELARVAQVAGLDSSVAQRLLRLHEALDSHLLAIEARQEAKPGSPGSHMVLARAIHQVTQQLSVLVDEIVLIQAGALR